MSANYTFVSDILALDRRNGAQNGKYYTDGKQFYIGMPNGNVWRVPKQISDFFLTNPSEVPYPVIPPPITSLTLSGDVTGQTDANTVIAILGNLIPVNAAGALTNDGAGVLTWTPSAGVGTVTSVGFTGGIISIATATTTPDLTVAGTSGGIPYFSSASTWASSALLTANALIIGGGAGVAPSTTTTGTGVLAGLAVNTGSVGAFVKFDGAAGTPSSITLTNGTRLPILTGVSGVAAGYLNGDLTTAAGTDTTITGLTFTMAASEVWEFECNLVGQVSGGSGARFTVVYSATPTSSFVRGNFNNTATNNQITQITLATTPAQTATVWQLATTEFFGNIVGGIKNGASSCTVTIKIQPVSGAQTATVRANSFITARRTG